jgi:hypothetical protein
MVRYVPLWYVLTNLLNIDYLSKIVEKESQVKSRTNINKKEIIKTWLTGQKSCTLIIPKEIAQKYELDEPSHVIVEETPAGILIRKLVLQKEED